MVPLSLVMEATKQQQKRGQFYSWTDVSVKGMMKFFWSMDWSMEKDEETP